MYFILFLHSKTNSTNRQLGWFCILGYNISMKKISKRMPAKYLVTVELIPDPEQGGFTAFIPDLPAIGEGKTEKEAIADLKKGIRLYVDEYGLEDALSRVAGPLHLRRVDIGDLVAHG